MRSVRNLPASVRQRLLDRARKDKRPFNELLQYYAMEWFLYVVSVLYVAVGGVVFWQYCFVILAAVKHADD